MKKILLLLLFLLVILQAFEPRVELKADKRKIAPNEEVLLVCTILVDKKDKDKIKLIPRKEISGFPILKKGNVKTSIETIADGKKEIEVISKKLFYTIAPDKEARVGPVTFFLADKEYKSNKVHIYIKKNTKKKVKKEEKKPQKKEQKSKNKEKQQKTKTLKKPQEDSIKKEAKTKENQKKEEKTKEKVVEKTPKVAQKEHNKATTIKEETKPKVTPKEHKKASIKDAISISMSLNKKEVVVHEPLILTVKIVTKPIELSMHKIEYKEPSLKNFIVEKKVSSEKVKDGKTITLFHYVLIPKKSGKIIIEPARIYLDMDIAPQIPASFGFFSAATQVNVISSKPLELKVLKAPKGVDIIGYASFSTQVNKTVVNPNEQVVYSVTLKGEGNFDDLELPTFNIPYVTVFKDEPEIKKELINNKFLTIYKQKYVFIPQKSFTIPVITLKVYSPRFKKISSIVTKPIDITVQNSSNSVAMPIASNINNNTTKIQEKELNLVLDTKYYKKKLQEANSKIPLLEAFIAGLFLGVLALMALPKILNYLKYKNNNAPLFGSYQEALHILYPHTTKSKEYEEMVAMLYEVINGNSDIKIDNKKLNELVKRVKKESI